MVHRSSWKGHADQECGCASREGRQLVRFTNELMFSLQNTFSEICLELQGAFGELNLQHSQPLTAARRQQLFGIEAAHGGLQAGPGLGGDCRSPRQCVEVGGLTRTGEASVGGATGDVVDGMKCYVSCLRCLS